MRLSIIRQIEEMVLVSFLVLWFLEAIDAGVGLTWVIATLVTFVNLFIVTAAEDGGWL